MLFQNHFALFSPNGRKLFESCLEFSLMANLFKCYSEDVLMLSGSIKSSLAVAENVIGLNVIFKILICDVV